MPERRRRVRIVTLKNFGIAAIALVVLLIAANLISEARKTRGGGYGALFGKELQKTETVAPRKVEVVTEAPVVQDSNTTDPMLLAPAAREQYLEVKPVVATPPTQTQPDPKHVAIVGDDKGVAPVGSRRLLSGGFGK